MAPGPLRRPLPLVAGREHLSFRCHRCGACCRSLRVPLTHLDLARLEDAVAEPRDSLVDWLAPAQVEPGVERADFVELGVGPRLLVLAQRAGACTLLGADDRCTAYAARPYDCRLYPLVLESEPRRAGWRLEMLELEGCGTERGPEGDLEELAALSHARARELAAYRDLVARWNRAALRRRRFRHRIGGPREFLALARNVALGAAALAETAP
jgi:Fe-S-cluster containining protein